MRFFFLFLIITTSLFSYEVIEDRRTLPVLTPAFQESTTKKIVLDNKLKVYLISDPSAEKSAVALSVNAGSWEDPDDHPGLAHFLEHMLFMGTEKYPDEASFGNYIQQHGGKTNAFTEDQYTTFLFEISSDGLDEALDRFSQFFKHPLIKSSGISREIQAVEQEFSGHRQRDDSRRILVYKELSNPDHPFSKFNFGNRRSLRHSTTDDLRKWFEEHYSSNQMSLILYSPLDIEKLTKLAEQHFSGIPNKHFTSPQYNIPMFSESMIGKVLYIEPKKDDTKMMMVWELPKKFAPAIDTRPDELVCHVLGHEGKESLLAQLQREGLALELGCGGARWGNDVMAFIIEITLTHKGVKNPFAVGTRIFQAIERLKQQDYPRYLFDEVQTVGRIKLQYPQRKEPFDEVKKHSRNIRFEKLATYPEATNVIQKYDPALIHELLEALTPENVVMDITAKPQVAGVAPTRKEKWMGTLYAVRDIPPDVMREWKQVASHSQIDWPAPNPMIPKKLVVEKNQETKPTLAIDDPFGKLYWVPDHQYQVPKISWTFRLFTPSIDAGNPKSNVMTDLYLKLVKKQLTHTAYLAQLGQLEYEIKQVTGGIEIKLNGFSDKAPKFFREIVQAMTQINVTKESFDVFQKALENHYGNISAEEPYLQAIDLFKKVLYERYSTEREKEKAIEQITYDEFQTFVTHLFDNSYIEGLLFGNGSPPQVKQIWNDLKPIRQSPYLDRTKRKVAILPQEGGPYSLSQERQVKGNAVLVMIEDPHFSFTSYAAQEILSTMLSGPFFDELRTKQQTAYLIANLHELVENKFFTILLLQSFSYAPQDLLARIELFLETFPKLLSQETFQSVKKAFIQKLTTPPESLKKQGEELAKLLFDKEADFEWKEQAAKAAKALTYEEFVEYVQKFLGKGNARRLAFLIQGSSDDGVFQYHKADSIEWLRGQIQYTDK